MVCVVRQREGKENWTEGGDGSGLGRRNNEGVVTSTLYYGACRAAK